MTVPETILVASHNAGKIAEITELFTPLGVKVTSAAELGLHLDRRLAWPLLALTLSACAGLAQGPALER